MNRAYTEAELEEMLKRAGEALSYAYLSIGFMIVSVIGFILCFFVKHNSLVILFAGWASYFISLYFNRKAKKTLPEAFEDER